MSRKTPPWLRNLLKEAEALSRYDVGLTAEALAGRLGVDPSSILKLNSNENLFIPLEFLRNLLMEVVEELDPRFYPRDEFAELQGALAGYLGVNPERIVLGAGSDQLIELLVHAFLKRGETVLSISPTFSIYERVVRAMGADYEAVPLKEDFSLDVGGMLNSADEGTRITFICSPNNPTANQFSYEAVKSIVEGFRGLIVLDETYAEFAKYSAIDLTEKHENLVVLRTFSKVFGIAGLRLGYAVSSPEVASTLRERYQMPYAVSSIALRMGVKLLERIDAIRRSITRLKEERASLIRGLNRIERVQAFNSETNFVLMNLQGMSSDDVYERLLDHGVIVRNIG